MLFTSFEKHTQQSFSVFAAGPLHPPTQHRWPTVQLGPQLRCMTDPVVATVLDVVPPPPVPSLSSRGVRAPQAERQTATETTREVSERGEVMARP